jgi:L-ascorbate metabolism protein UlaG (beta-lactamase superfamily)
VSIAPPASPSAFALWWLGQSGFALRYLDEMAVIDPYLSDSLTKKYARTSTPHVRMTRIAIPPSDLAAIGVTVVTASHHHTDHLDPETLRPMVASARAGGAPIRLLAPEASRALAAERAGLEPEEIVGMDDGTVTRVGRFTFTGIASAHERLERDPDGHSVYLGYVMAFGGWTVYHSGDTVAYPGLAERLAPFNVDLALLPINGRVGNMPGRDAARLAKACGAKLVVPCHYDMFEFNTADPGDEFVPECERIGQPYRVLKVGEQVTIPALRI